MITFVEVAIGSDGELGCRRCGASSTQPHVRRASDVGAELASIATGWRYGPGPNVSFIGIEPFVHPELPQLIAAATSAGFSRVRLRTDGGALAKADNAAGAFSAGVRHLEIVLLGSAKTHDERSGRSGLFDDAAAGATAFSRAAESSAVSITARIPVCRHSVFDVAGAVVAAAALGASAATIDASGLKWSTDREALLDAALETATVNRVAACVINWDGGWTAPYDRTPWQSLPGVTQ
ncbi:MAG TPA: hypothetical protein VLA05_06660 [Coriobacteriia bacterium]|nr:hypothetical protein [Coriobacteriia bacterium]